MLMSIATAVCFSFGACSNEDDPVAAARETAPAKQQQRFLPTSPATPRRAGSLKGYYSQFNEDIKFFEWYKTAGLSVLYN